MENELTILSPEKTILTYPLAGIARRVLAHLLDVMVVVGLVLLILLISGFWGAFTAMISFSIGVVIASAMPFLYFILLEGFWNGRTFGKAACGLRVRMQDGTPIRVWAAVARNLIRVADFVPPPYFAGVLAIFTTPRSQRIGDLLAGTVVVQERRAVPVFNPAPHKAGIHPYEEMVGDLRGMTNEEYIALKRLCDRFYELTPEVKIRLMAEVFYPVALKRSIPAPPEIHPLYLAEATVMKYGRQHGLL